MFKIQIIGNLGADASVVNSNGNEYVSFRVAHSEKFKKSDGTDIETTVWASCFMKGRQNVMEYLKKGTKVYIDGQGKLDIYSSPKTKRMECGITINVTSLELCGGGNFDDVPRQLVNDNGELINVTKHYWTPIQGKGGTTIRDKANNEYVLDDNGFVKPLQQVNEQANEQSNEPAF